MNPSRSVRLIFATGVGVMMAACATNNANNTPRLGVSVMVDWQTNCTLRNECDPHSNPCFAKEPVHTKNSACERKRQQRQACVQAAQSYEQAYACEAWRVKVYGP